MQKNHFFFKFRSLTILLILPVLILSGQTNEKLFREGKKEIIISPFERANLHSLSYDKPAPDFFEGALLGNGGMGEFLAYFARHKNKIINR